MEGRFIEKKIRQKYILGNLNGKEKIQKKEKKYVEDIK